MTEPFNADYHKFEVALAELQLAEAEEMSHDYECESTDENCNRCAETHNHSNVLAANLRALVKAICNRRERSRDGE